MVVIEAKCLYTNKKTISKKSCCFKKEIIKPEGKFQLVKSTLSIFYKINVNSVLEKHFLDVLAQE